MVHPKNEFSEDPSPLDVKEVGSETTVTSSAETRTRPARTPQIGKLSWRP